MGGGIRDFVLDVGPAVSRRTIRLTMSWPAFEWQLEATRDFYHGLRSSVRYFVWVVSRQVGKTAMLESVLLRQAMSGGTYGYFAPSYDRSEEVYNECCEAILPLVDAGLASNKQTKAGWVIRFKVDFCRAFARSVGLLDWAERRPGALLFKSLGNPEHLRGGTLDGEAIDETALVTGRVYRKILEPFILAKDGWVIFSGTPPEDDEVPDPAFFRGLAEYAESGVDDQWSYLHRDFTCHPEPRFVLAVEKKRILMPEDEFAREYLATFPNAMSSRLPTFRWYGPSQDVQAVPKGRFVGTGVDLADNDNEIGDKAALVTYAVTAGGYVWIMCAEYFRNPSEVQDGLYSHQSLYSMDTVKLQKASFDKGFRFTIQQGELAGRGQLPLEMTPMDGSSKRRRIMQLEPIARAGKLFVHESCLEFAREWEQFPDGLTDTRRRNKRTNHYDILDAATACVPDMRNFSLTEKVDLPRNTMADLRKALKAKSRGIPMSIIRDRYFSVDKGGPWPK